MLGATVEKVTARNVSMYPADWEIVDAADTNSAGTSATLRYIVREWERLHSHPLRGVHVLTDASGRYEYVREAPQEDDE